MKGRTAIVIAVTASMAICARAEAPGQSPPQLEVPWPTAPTAPMAWLAAAAASGCPAAKPRPAPISVVG